LPPAVTIATLEYLTPGATDYVAVNVLTTVNAQTTVVGEFKLAEEIITPLDGEYKFKYTLSDGVGTVSKSISVFILCGVRCCIDKLWAKAAQNLSSDEDCGCSGSTTSYSKKAALAEAYYVAITHGVACGDTVTRDALLKKLQRICKLENCNC
jgi:hypothetical protein